jgi:hypothetical protein
MLRAGTTSATGLPSAGRCCHYRLGSSPASNFAACSLAEVRCGQHVTETIPYIHNSSHIGRSPIRLKVAFESLNPDGAVGIDVTRLKLKQSPTRAGIIS